MACAREESSESSLEFDLCSDDCDDSDISFDDNGPSKVYEAAKSGDAALLNELLLDMDDSERAHTFEATFVELIEGQLTPLLAASMEGKTDCVKVLLRYKADVDGRGRVLRYGHDGGRYRLCTPLFVASGNGHVDVLNCLIENGADVNAVTPDEGCIPLMDASFNGRIDAIEFLVKHGANLDHQDKYGNTALHYAVHDPIPDKQVEVFQKLLSLGASQLYNKQRLTPLLFACNKGMISLVEKLLLEVDYTDEQRIDALELLGASLATTNLHSKRYRRGFDYIEEGMGERFEDPTHPVLKQPVQSVEAYQNTRESQNLEELAQIENNRCTILMEGLVIRERILGTDNMELIEPIREVAEYFFDRYRNLNVAIGLHRHAMKIARLCHQSAFSDLCSLIAVLSQKFGSNVHPREEELLELLEQTVLEYEYEKKLKNELQERSEKISPNSTMFRELLYSSARLVQVIAKCEEVRTSSVLSLLKKLLNLNPQDDLGNTLLHKVVIKRSKKDTFPCPVTTKLLLDEGISVNATNYMGNTPLHKAVTGKLGNDKIHLVTSVLKILLERGAHQDFVNHNGQTAMELAQTDEARATLSNYRNLELKCLSARAVRKFGLPYLDMVPKTLEKFVSMH